MSHSENEARKRYEERNTVPKQYRAVHPLDLDKPHNYPVPGSADALWHSHARDNAWATQRLREQGKLRG